MFWSAERFRWVKLTLHSTERFRWVKLMFWSAERLRWVKLMFWSAERFRWAKLMVWSAERFRWVKLRFWSAERFRWAKLMLRSSERFKGLGEVVPWGKRAIMPIRNMYVWPSLSPTSSYMNHQSLWLLIFSGASWRQCISEATQRRQGPWWGVIEDVKKAVASLEIA